MMSFITLSNTKKIIFSSDLENTELKGEIYKIPIYFFSKYEANSLLAIQELLKDPERYFSEIYKPYKVKDTYKYVYEGQRPGYHEFSDCPRLNSDFQNFEIPFEIKEQGIEAIEEFRYWFKSVEYLLDKPDVFVARLHARWGIITNPKAINRDNSGIVKFDNINIEDLEKIINNLIKSAGRFYYASDKNKAILDRFAKCTFLANKKEKIYSNDTDYNDKEVKDLLKFYEQKYKHPLKAKLIEYYRLKLNPEIKMEGYLLERLGFKACTHCHNDNYKTQDPNIYEDQDIIDYESESLNIY